MLAILLQLAITATHHHAVFLGGAERIGGQQSVVAPQDGGSAPASDEGCEICLGLALGSTFVLPDGAPLDVLPPPLPRHWSPLQDRERAVRLAFHSRAPPSL
jgi:hypothetical protein